MNYINHMVKNLVRKTEFASMAGVSAAAVTKASAKSLQPAMVGKRVDVDHPAAVEYIDRQMRPERKIGIDSLYEEAVKACTQAENYRVGFVKRIFKVGDSRAKKVIDTMRVNGVIPADWGKKPAVAEKTPAPAPPPINVQVNHVRGHNAARETKKRAAGGALPVIEIPENIEEFADMTVRELILKFGTDTRFCDWLRATKLITEINEKRLKNAATKGTLVSRELVKNGVLLPVDTCHRRILSDGARSLSVRIPAKHDAGESQKQLEKYIRDQLTSFIKPMKTKVSKALRQVKGVD